MFNSEPKSSLRWRVKGDMSLSGCLLGVRDGVRGAGWRKAFAAEEKKSSVVRIRREGDLVGVLKGLGGSWFDGEGLEGQEVARGKSSKRSLKGSSIAGCGG